MARNIYRFKGNFKSFLFVFGICLIVGFIYYTNLLVKELQQQSREFLQFKARIFEENINSEQVTDLSFFFNEIIRQADYPIIYTDADNVPQFWRNVDIPPSNSQPPEPADLKRLNKLIRKFDAINDPIPVSYQGHVLGYYHYGESAIIQRLRWLPYVQVVVVVLFILIGYAGFSSIKKSEERFIWVGMAKETAHQLGTPLSSLLGWVEYLKSSPEQLPRVLSEIEKDLQRLQVITNRFSQIGSLPDVKPENLRDIVEETVSYFQRRLPQKNGRVQLQCHSPEQLPLVKVNRDLFTWVLENLIKNALDSLDGKPGRVDIRLQYNPPGEVIVEVSDTGRGIPPQHRKNIFKPGFSTKKRGWGLGLSLAKRIVEDYHGGKLSLKDSQAGRGSTFRVVLNLG